MNEGSQTNLATCDLFPVAMMSFTPATTVLLEPLFFWFVLPEKENKKLKTEQLATYKCT